jgi:hypothetical protein
MDCIAHFITGILPQNTLQSWPWIYSIVLVQVAGVFLVSSNVIQSEARGWYVHSAVMQYRRPVWSPYPRSDFSLNIWFQKELGTALRARRVQ